MTEERHQHDRALDDRITLSLGVPSPQDLRDLAAEDYHTVVDFRTDEEIDALPPADEERLARELGLDYVHLPVTGRGMNAQTVERFGSVVRRAQPKLYVHCSAGGRAASVAMSFWGFQHHLSPEDVIGRMRDLGLPGSADFVRSYVGDRVGH